VGDLAETEGHHPDISFGWSYATISLHTKKIKGLHKNDFIMASKIDRMFDRPEGPPIISEVGKLEPWQTRAIVLSPFSAEPAFSVAVSFGIFVCTAFAFGLHQGIPTAATCCVVLMIRNFDRSRPTFMMSGQLPRRLLMLTAR
jgi:hypothetical protein